MTEKDVADPEGGNVAWKRRAPVDVAIDNPVVVVSLVGALVYVATRLGQVSFYGEFGLDPEDVGIGYAETLTRAAAAILPLVLLTIWVGAMATRVIGERGRTWVVQLVRERRAGFAALSVLFLFGTFVYAVFGLPVQYARIAADVQSGDTPALDPRRIGPQLTNPLGIRAERVRVTWIEQGEAPYKLDEGQAFVYLGHANGLTALYDLKYRRTVRVPDTSIAVVLGDE